MSHVAVGHEYREAVDWLLSRIDYERMLSVPYQPREYRLERMRDLLSRLNNPQRQLAIVHIAGTKGKGSTSAMIAGILTASGKRTGLYTSPHLDRMEERLAIDGVPCPATRLAPLVSKVRAAVEAMEAQAGPSDEASGPTFFEVTTALALLHFAEAGVDAAVLEVGMGGRLDSTNVCEPRCCAITSISLDHTQQLGDTLAKIAWEKAGIIKPGVPVISGVCDAEPRQVIADMASERGAPLVQLGRDFEFKYLPARAVDCHAAAASMDFRHRRRESGASNGEQNGEPTALDGVQLGMWGRHQGANAAVALAVIEELRRQGWPIAETAVRRGLAETRCRARVELLSRHPAVVVDAAHNVASVAALLDVLGESFAAPRRHLIFGTSRDKDARGMLAQLLPHFQHVVLTRYQDNPRGTPPEELAALAGELGCPSIEATADPPAAWSAATRTATPETLILATGSFFVAAEIRRLVVAASASPSPSGSGSA